LAACGPGSSVVDEAAAACDPGTPGTGGRQICTASQGNVGNGYSYSLWSDGTGSGCMTLFGSDAKFSATWTNVGDFLARAGLGFNRSTTYDKIGTISADFVETKTGGGNGGYIGIYGWSVNPLHEYYIVDDWFGSRPNPGTKIGTITVDDGTYDVMTHTQMDQPSIMGTQTFVQYFSIRQSRRQCGHISVTEHFSQWAAMNLTLGNLVEARLLVEAMNSSGSIEFTTATVVVQ
jgi:hypothetical protein